jgi:phosphoribosylaminoimidazole synthetase
VLEFNCRFGDPETQVLLPLLKTDLVDIVSACMEGRLSDLNIVWQDRHAVSVVLASGGYPRSYAVGKEILGISDAAALDETVVFQAGTRVERGHLATAGGRVLAVTAVGDTLEEARDRAYRGVQHIRFDGLQYRRDIGELEATTLGDSVASERAARAIKSAYAAAGVDIEAGNQAVDMMREAVAATYTDAVLAGIGPFGGLFSARSAYGCADDPVLVASTDGVGTKTMIAAAMGKYDTIGHDIVNHCLNDTLVQGARPLFFLDYVATGAVDPEQIAAIVTGCAEACGKIGCALIGGETAEMPGVYRPGTFDLVGTMVSWVERNGIVDGHAVEVGDVCIGIPSSGLHTNGYSLARRVFSGVSWSTVYPELGEPLGDVLLTPHRAYLREVEALWEAGVCPKAMAHITGGGFPDNLPRVLPSGVGVALDRSTWDTPPVFRLIQRMGQVSLDEMYRVYNMGIGLVIIVAAEDAQSALDVLAGDGRQVGVTFAHEGGPRVRW